ncbi:NRF6 protein, partial [Acromyrmex insinuator]
MAIALLGKCVALLALIVLLYATCYGFRIRDVVPQTHHPTVCVSTHGRICPTDKTVTTEGPISIRKWHEGTVPRTIAGDRKPPAELTSDIRTGRIRMEKITEHPRDRDVTRLPRSSRIESDDIDDDEEEEEAVVEVESVEEDEESVGDSARDQKKQMEEIKTTKIVKSIKYAKSKTDDDKEEEDDKKEKKAAKTDQQKVIESLKKKFSAPHKKGDKDEDEDEDEDEESDVKETTPAPKKLEKVRLADKDKTRTTILQSKRNVEKSKQDDKKPPDVAKSAIKTESVKKTTESTKKIESVESTKESIDSTKKSVESAKKLTESTKKVESVKATPKPKAEVLETATKVDEKSKIRVKSETSIPAPKIKEQAKQPEKMDVKKVTAKPTSKPSKEVSQAEKQETKLKTKVHTDAITLSEVNDAILRVPTFVPNFTNVENSECQQHGKIFLRQLRGYKLWALQMLDSSAKIPSGLLRGNVNQLGDYDQCLGVLAHVKVDEKTIRIQGKYCLATVDLHATHSDMRLPVHLMQARAFMRGNMHDPGHFLPKFTSFNWALCLPAACSAKDAEYALESTLKDYNGTVGIKFTVNVDPNMCYVKQKSQTYSKETIGVLYFYAMIICLVIIATVRDYFVETRGKGNYSERIIMSFSLRRTIKALLKEATDAADITCIYGIRTLAMIVLYVGHQLMTIPRIPFSNRISFTEIANSPASSILRVALVYTDTFLLLSGVLTAYNMAKELKTRGEIRWFCRFVARFIRLSPALLAVVFWYAFVMEHIGSGPQWNSVVMANAELCKYNAWTTLLYVQNFFPFEEMCASHTHQLALDMQLSLLAPILVFFLQYKLIIGMLLMAFLILLSATLRYIATINNYLSIVIYHGISLKRLYKTANLTYVLPLHRTTPYVFGVGLGVLLHYTGKNVRIHRVLVILGWLIAITLGSWSLFSPWRQAKRDYVYDAEEATHYAVIGPVLWAAALCWSIFACFTGHGVFFYNVGTTRFSTEFQLHRAIDLLEVAIVIAASIVLTLLFDLPMQEVKSVIMESTDVALEVSEEKKTFVSEDKKAETAIEQANVFENDEVTFTGWDRQKDIVHDTEEEIDVPTLKKMNGKRLSFIDRDSEEISNKDRVKQASKKPLKETESYTDRKIGMNRQRYATDDSEEEAVEFLRNQRQHDEAVAQRNRRSLSRTKENKRLKESESEEERRKKIDDDSRQFKRSESRGRTSTKADDYRSWEFVGKEGSTREQHESKPPLVRSARRRFSSESEEEPSAQERTKPVRVSSSETKTSDEEEWEHELRIRKKQFMEKLATQHESLVEESEISAEPLKRRSSAEGRIALLREDISGEDNMDSWTVSVGPRIALLGSSQEPSEPEEDGMYLRRREYREQGPPSREESLSEEESSQDISRRQSYTSDSQKTSLEEEDNVNNYNFILTKGSKRESLQDLSQLSQEDLASAGWNVVKKEGDLSVKPTGLFKRESIVKSQASEEDPEYLLPERPKLVQQEREHPFKKAWQMQKSRSEEEGSSAYIIKDSKEQQSETKAKEPSIKRELSGAQSEDSESFADDESVEVTVMLRGRSTDTEDTRTNSTRSGTDETDSVSTECSRAMRERDHRQSSKSETDEDSAKFNWPDEEEEEAPESEIYRTGHRGKSEEVDWDWEREET